MFIRVNLQEPKDGLAKINVGAGQIVAIGELEEGSILFLKDLQPMLIKESARVVRGLIDKAIAIV